MSESPTITIAQPDTRPEYDEVVAGLYRAAAGSSPWRDALDGVSRHLNAWGVQILAIDLQTGAMAFSLEGGGLPPDGALEYLRYWNQLDPRVALLAHWTEGQWSSCHEHFDDAFVARDPFYRDFLIPYGGRYVSGTKVYQDDHVMAFFGVHRGNRQRPLNLRDLQTARRLGGHVRTALSLWRRQQASHAQALVGHALLDRLSHAALLIDDQLRVQHANPLALALLGRPGSGLSLHGGALRSDSVKINLLHAARQWSQTEPTRLNTTAQPRSDRWVCSVNGPDGEASLALVMSALRPQQTQGSFGHGPLLLVLLHDRRMRPQPDAFIAAAVFDMTPAEAQVAVRVAQGQSVEDLARELGIRMSTARTHVRRALEKTGAKRLPDLAAALAALPGTAVSI